MKARVTVVTLGVDDLERSVRFYHQGLGLPTEAMLRREVEHGAVMRQAVAAGATAVRPAQPTFWGGYAGYFQDPDQHLWEVVWNPQWASPI